MNLGVLFKITDSCLQRQNSSTVKMVSRLPTTLVSITDPSLALTLDIMEIQQEIVYLSGCSSDHVTRYYGSFVGKGWNLWIVMEYLAGGSGLDIVRDIHKATPDSAAFLLTLQTSVTDQTWTYVRVQRCDCTSRTIAWSCLPTLTGQDSPRYQSRQRPLFLDRCRQIRRFWRRRTTDKLAEHETYIRGHTLLDGPRSHFADQERIRSQGRYMVVWYHSD